MKKKIKYFVFVILTLIIVDRCTEVNVTSSPIFGKKEFKSYPFLKDGVSSDSYEIKYIIDGYKEFTYDTINNYFIINTAYKILKISGEGKVLNNIEPIYPKEATASAYSSSERVYTPVQSYFLMGTDKDSLVYNLSKSKIKEKLTKIITTSHIKTQEEWLAFYTPYYNMADVVIYRVKFEGIEDVQPIYLKINNKWILILFSENYKRNLAHPEEGFPEKYPKLIHLKDYKRHTYSKISSSLEKTPWEETISESHEKGFEKKFFRKTYTHQRFLNLYYIELFPYVFEGTGFFNLTIGEDLLKFKNNMYQTSFFEERTGLSYFTLPKQFRKKTEVSFIEYDSYLGNIPGEGLYIIKRKE